MRRVGWSSRRRPVPRHPYRDTAILYAGLAGLVVVLAAATGGDVLKATLIALGAFVLATAFSWWRWRERLRAVPEEEKR